MLIRRVSLGLLALGFWSLGCVPRASIETDDWDLHRWSDVVVTAGSSVTVMPIVRNKSASRSWKVTASLKEAAPPAWSFTLPVEQILSRNVGEEAGIPFDITVPEGEPEGIRIIPIRFSDGEDPGNDTSWNMKVTVARGTFTTGIRETAPFSVEFDRVHRSELEVTNGESHPITTMCDTRGVDFTPVLDALVWFAPNSGGFSADPADAEQLHCRALARTNRVARTFALENFFYDGATEYKYATHFEVEVPTDVTYEITDLDWLMGVKMEDPDKSAHYTVRLDPVPTDRAGLYTFSIDDLDMTQYSATIEPPTASINSSSDPVDLTVTITRIGDGSGETTDEFTLRAVHEHAGDITARLRLPIRTYLGRQ